MSQNFEQALDGIFEDRPGEPLVFLPRSKVAQIEDLSGLFSRSRQSLVVAS